MTNSLETTTHKPDALANASDWMLQRLIDRGHPRAADAQALLETRTGNAITDQLVDGIAAVLNTRVPGLEVDVRAVRSYLPEFIAQVRNTSAVA